MSSLRKKIHEHKNSEAHIKATNILQQFVKKKQIEKDISELKRAKYLTTEKIFRTVYKITKTKDL